MSRVTRHLYFFQCALGVEELLCAELGALGLEGHAEEGGVSARGEQRDLYRVYLKSRVVESIRVRLKEFQAQDFTRLKREVEKAPLRAFLDSGSPARVKVVCHESRLWHSGAVAQRVEEALVERAGLVMREGEESAVVHVRLDKDQVQLSLEVAGNLHRRGYRARVEKASLRETLGAALVQATFTRPDAPSASAFIWDPFCGAGTVLLEALDMARGRALLRPEAPLFVRLRNHEPTLYEEVVSEFRGESSSRSAPWFTPEKIQVLGSDVSREAVASARGNYEAGVFEGGEFLQGDIEAIEPKVPEGAVVITNPPYGKRLEKGGALYKLLRVIERRPDLKPVVVLVGGEARSAVPKSAIALFRTKNGGIPVSARLLTAPSTENTR